MPINRYEYSWEDIKVIIPGQSTPIEGITAIEYDYDKEHTNIYAAGARPVAMGRGKEEPSAKITLLQSEVEAMTAALPRGKNLTHMAAFTITVSYAPEGGAAVTDQLIGCRFKKMPKGMKTGDVNKEIELELAVFDIKYNV